MWWIYALLSVVFASLTAIFAKTGVANVNSALATAIRTVVILIVAWGIVLARGELKGVGALSRHTVLFLILSGVDTGLSWIFYYKALQLGKVSKVASVDKLSVALTIILSALILKETLSSKPQWGAIMISRFFL